MAQVVVRQQERLKAWPQVAEGECRDVMDVVVLEKQLAQTPWQVGRDLSELVVGKVQGFQGTKRKQTDNGTQESPEPT